MPRSSRPSRASRAPSPPSVPSRLAASAMSLAHFGGLLAHVGDHHGHLAALHHRHVVQLHLEGERVDVVGAGLEHVELRAALAARLEEFGGVLEIAVARHRFRHIFLVGKGIAVQRRDEAHALGGDDGGVHDLHPEERHVDAVGPRQQDVDLRPLLAAQCSGRPGRPRSWRGPPRDGPGAGRAGWALRPWRTRGRCVPCPR